MKRIVPLVSVTLLAAAYVACGGATSSTPPGADAGASSSSSGGSSTSSGGSSSGGSSSGASGSSSSSGSSSGGDAGDGGGSSSGGAALSFGPCAAFAPCTDPVDGTYAVTGGCIDDPLAPFRGACPGLVQKSLTGTVAGTVAFAGGMMTRNVSSTLSAKITLPAECTQGAPCAFVGPFIQNQVPGSTASCTGASACDCDVKITVTDNVADTYTQTASSVATGAGDTFDVCKTGKILEYTQTGGAQPRPGSYTLTEK